MSLLLDALKQAERNKAQSGGQGNAPAFGDPRIRLDSIDLELGEPPADKVELFVEETQAVGRGAAGPRSTVVRAMQEPALRSGRRAVEAEAEQQQSAKQLFAAKQSARKPALTGTWIAGLAVAALAIASGLIYFWNTKRGETLTARAPAISRAAPIVPSSTPPLDPQPAASSTPAAALPSEAPLTQTQPETQIPTLQAASPPVAAPDPAPADTPNTNPEGGAQPSEPVAPESAAVLAIESAAAESIAKSQQQPVATDARSAAGAPAAAPAVSNSASDGEPAVSNVPGAAEEEDEQATLSAAAAKPRKATAKSDRPTLAERAAQGGDASVVQSAKTEAVEAPTRGRQGRKQSAAVAETNLSLQRSPPAQGLHPDLAAAYQALIAGDTAAAAQRYQAVLNADAFNLDAELGLATIAASQGDRIRARRHYRRALELDPKNDVALAGLASLASAGGSSSESGLKTQLAEQPSSHHLHFALGNDFARQQRWPDAQQAYFNAYSLDPDNPDYAYNLAVSLDHMTQPRAALSYYQRAQLLSEARSAQFSRAQLDRRINELRQP